MIVLVGDVKFKQTFLLAGYYIFITYVYCNISAFALSYCVGGGKKKLLIVGD